MSKDLRLDDRAWRRLQKKIAKGASHVKVGILASKGGNERPDGELSLVEIAAVHEFGSPAAGIQERSFIRRTFILEKAELIKTQAGLAKQVVTRNLSMNDALEILGQWGAAAVKKTVTVGNNLPPLKPATVVKKGSDRPLVDTGRMIQSVSYEVEK